MSHSGVHDLIPEDSGPTNDRMFWTSTREQNEARQESEPDMAHDSHVGISLGLLAGAFSVLQESANAAFGILEKSISTAVVTAVATTIGFFGSRWLNATFPPKPPKNHTAPPPGQS